ncbi:MAG: hypothetical protein HRU17_10925 [Polyangiaceae bacterium]|nr:hypothetical protein [Polyangiaceae bacterium]
MSVTSETKTCETHGFEYDDRSDGCDVCRREPMRPLTGVSRDGWRTAAGIGVGGALLVALAIFGWDVPPPDDAEARGALTPVDSASAEAEGVHRNSDGAVPRVRLGPLSEPLSATPKFQQTMWGIQNCYAVALEKEPNLRGKLKMDLTVGTDGAIISAERSESTPVAEPALSDDAMVECVLGVMRTVGFQTRSTSRVYAFWMRFSVEMPPSP